MGLFDFFRRLLFGAPPPRRSAPDSAAQTDRDPSGGPRTVPPPATLRRRRPRLTPPRRRPAPPSHAPPRETATLPYRFAHFTTSHRGYLDLTTDGDPSRLAAFGLPAFRTPEELAAFLQLPVGKVAWLIHRFEEQQRPPQPERAHYHHRWTKKRSGGWRLIEAPKRMLKTVQRDVLREILDRVPAHPAAHGFVKGRSIVTNARPHVGARVVLKFDLENFYANVGFARVTAVFRGLGYCREAAIWLARLTTSAVPRNLELPPGAPLALWPYLARHLPQGAPTSPALANLSAFGLDVRLDGLARSFGAVYTRYADDLTFSGPDGFRRALATFIPLVEQVVRQERFRVHRAKRKVVRSGQRMTVTGVVVNTRTNVSRAEHDRLKAILTNCVRHGPASQNRERHEEFSAHLRGRISHVAHLNPERGAKLLALYRRIRW